MELAAEGELSGAAVERFFGGNASKVGRVVLFGNVGEDEMASASVEDFGIGEEFADDGVGKVAGAAHHTLLDVPGIRTDFQHFEIVIRFENQEIGFAEMEFHDFGHVAEVGDDGDFFAVGAESVADGVGGIVRNRERGDFDIADDELNAGADVFVAVEARFRAVFVHLANFAVRRLGEIGGAMPIASELRETGGVIAVFVSEEHAVEMFRTGAAKSFEAAKEFFFSETSVNEDSGASGFEQCAIARAA